MFWLIKIYAQMKKDDDWGIEKEWFLELNCCEILYLFKNYVNFY